MKKKKEETKPKFISTCLLLWLGHLAMSNSFATPWTVARQPPLTVAFSRQEYWSGLPCPPPGNLPDPLFELMSLTSPAWAGRFFTTNSYHLQMIEKLEICLLYMEKVIYMNEKYLMHYGLCGW